jgi:hypothetical protein
VRTRVVVLLFGVVSACGLFPDLTGLAGDAGVDAFEPDVSVDAPGVDAVADATKSDAATNDGGAGDAADAADGGWCATHPNHTFCEDFDEPGFAARWTGISLNPSSSTVIESDAAAISPPNEMLASATFPPDSNANAYVYRHFSTAKTLKVQAEILVDPVGLPQIDPVMIVLSPPPPGYTRYDIHVDTGDGHLGNNYTPDGGSAINTDTNFANPLSAWHNLEIDLDLTKSSIQLYVDGVLATTWTLAPTSPTGFDLRIGVTAGLGTVDASTTGVVHVDNVLVDIQ